MRTAEEYFREQYAAHGAAAQRRWPNEDLVRAVARHRDDPSRLVLDLGCGNGANMRMMEAEGFDVRGVDTATVDGYPARVMQGDMTLLPYGDGIFDGVTDCFSSYCLSTEDFPKMLREAYRVLKPGGWFWSLHPSTESDAFHRSDKIDEWTVCPIAGAFAGNDYPFRFISEAEYRRQLFDAGFVSTSFEKTCRTYGRGSEYFWWHVVEARKA